MAARAALTIADHEVEAGTRAELTLPIARLASGTPVSMPVVVLHGAEPGPSVWVNAAIHGDEIGGVEVIRRVLEQLDPATLQGTLIAVPIVNVHGFLNISRYLPDRRDLNRHFPGRPTGSLARTLAHLLMTEVVARCSVGIDLHTGSDGRSNLPQVRADLEDPEIRRLAEAFRAPMLLNSSPGKGTLRRAAWEEGSRVLVFEGGQAQRFDPEAVRAGTEGVLRVLAALEMVGALAPEGVPSMVGENSRWVRARRSGLAEMECALGERVEKGQVLGRVHDAVGHRLTQFKSPRNGVVIGLKMEPLVDRGDALVHVASIAD